MIQEIKNTADTQYKIFLDFNEETITKIRAYNELIENKEILTLTNISSMKLYLKSENMSEDDKPINPEHFDIILTKNTIAFKIKDAFIKDYSLTYGTLDIRLFKNKSLIAFTSTDTFDPLSWKFLSTDNEPYIITLEEKDLHSVSVFKSTIS